MCLTPAFLILGQVTACVTSGRGRLCVILSSAAGGLPGERSREIPCHARLGSLGSGVGRPWGHAEAGHRGGRGGQCPGSLDTVCSPQQSSLPRNQATVHGPDVTVPILGDSVCGGEGFGDQSGLFQPTPALMWGRRRPRRGGSLRSSVPSPAGGRR